MPGARPLIAARSLLIRHAPRFTVRLGDVGVMSLDAPLQELDVKVCSNGVHERGNFMEEAVLVR